MCKEKPLCFCSATLFEFMSFCSLFSHQRNLRPQVCLPAKIQVLKAHQAKLPRRKNLRMSKMNSC